MPVQLTARDRVLLMTLMALNEEVSNPELKKRAGLSLERANRERLTVLGLVASIKRGRSLWYELTDKGWAWCEKELSHPAPPRSDTGTRGLYAVMAGLSRYLARAGLRSSDVFGQVDEAGNGVPVPVDHPGHGRSLAERIRAVYWELADQPGDWVSLTPVRGRLNDVTKAELDEVLRRLECEPDVHLVPETAQFKLTAADQAAAVRIGGKENHLLKVDRP